MYSCCSYCWASYQVAWGSSLTSDDGRRRDDELRGGEASVLRYVIIHIVFYVVLRVGFSVVLVLGDLVDPPASMASLARSDVFSFIVNRLVEGGLVAAAA